MLIHIYTVYLPIGSNSNLKPAVKQFDAGVIIPRLMMILPGKAPDLVQ